MFVRREIESKVSLASDGATCVSSKAMAPTTVRKVKFSSLLVIAVLLSPATAYADAGVPMLPVTYPLILLFLVPVIAIEAFYIQRSLRTQWRNTIIATTVTNTLSMLLGYPLIWILLVSLQFQSTDFLNQTHSAVFIMILTAAWPTPGYGADWEILAAFVILLIPAFLLSAFVEGILLSRFRWLRSDRRSTHTVWVANVLSYCFLAIAGCIVLWWKIKHP